jgi:hypothetical protein
MVGRPQRTSSGHAGEDFCRRHKISRRSVFRAKLKFDGMEIGDVAKMRTLEGEKRRLSSRPLIGPDPGEINHNPCAFFLLLTIARAYDTVQRSRPKTYRD